MPSDSAIGPAVGVLLAAGAGTRMGRPKALVVAADGEPWLHRGVRVLLEGGCDHVVVVLGADPDAATALLAELTDREPPVRDLVTAVISPDWAQGLSASLHDGLGRAAALGAAVVAVTLVDLPRLQHEAVARVLAGADASSLRQARYGDRPGHPVLIGSAHLVPLAASLTGDTGARPYLRRHGATPIDCTGLGGDTDVDHP